MKKIYALLAVAACTVSASAMTTLVAEQAGEMRANLEVAAKLTPAPMKAAATAPTGTYNVLGEGKVREGLLSAVGDGEFVESGEIWAITIEQSATDANWYRTKIYNENAPTMESVGEENDVYFYFNTANPDKVYSLGFSVYEDYTFYQMVTESGVDQMLANPTVVTGNPQYAKLENGLITFPARGFMYTDVSDKQHLFRANLSGDFAIAMPGTEMPEIWTTLGTSTWYDGIMGSMFAFGDGVTPGQPQVLESETVVQEKIAEPGVYRLMTPFMEWFDSAKHMVIDMTYKTADGTAVGAIDQTNTGVEDSEAGMTYILSRSINYANGVEGFVADTENFNKYNISWDAATRTINFPGNACFFYWPSWKPENVYSANTPLPSKITIPENAGVNDVVVSDSESSKVTFYNLQGVQVENPENGLYIVKQGNKVQKVLIRR